MYEYNHTLNIRNIYAHIDGLVQGCSNSNALTKALLWASISQRYINELSSDLKSKYPK